jgi:hypothetical protein
VEGKKYDASFILASEALGLPLECHWYSDSIKQALKPYSLMQMSTLFSSKLSKDILSTFL